MMLSTIWTEIKGLDDAGVVHEIEFVHKECIELMKGFLVEGQKILFETIHLGCFI
jgi:hypothetical protein